MARDGHSDKVTLVQSPDGTWSRTFHAQRLSIFSVLEKQSQSTWWEQSGPGKSGVNVDGRRSSSHSALLTLHFILRWESGEDPEQKIGVIIHLMHIDCPQ